jgi:hypothetical protein
MSSQSEHYVYGDVFYAGALSMLIENDEDVKLERLFKVAGLSEHPRHRSEYPSQETGNCGFRCTLVGLNGLP